MIIFGYSFLESRSRIVYRLQSFIFSVFVITVFLFSYLPIVGMDEIKVPDNLEPYLSEAKLIDVPDDSVSGKIGEEIEKFFNGFKKNPEAVSQRDFYVQQAIKNNQVRLFKFFIDKKICDPYAINGHPAEGDQVPIFLNSLYLAIFYDKKDMVKFLLSDCSMHKDINEESKTVDADSNKLMNVPHPLELAISLRRTEIIKILLDHGARLPDATVDKYINFFEEISKLLKPSPVVEPQQPSTQPFLYMTCAAGVVAVMAAAAGYVYWRYFKPQKKDETDQSTHESTDLITNSSDQDMMQISAQLP